MTTKDAIKHLSWKISFAKQCDEKWAGGVHIDALEIAVRAMAEERKKGKWIDDGKGLYMCSSCGKLWVHWWARIVPLNQMCKELRYCPMCGAEMEKTDE